MKSLKFRLKLTSKILFISIFTLLYFNGVFAISVNTSSSFQTNCFGANVNETIYITGSTVKIYPTDLMISNGKLLFVRNEESSVSIWQNTANTLGSGCFKELDSTNTGWGRLSNVVPGTNQYVGIFKNFGNLCDINKVIRTDTTRPSVQFVYRVAYKEELSVSTGTSSYFYYPYSSGVLSSSPSYLSDLTKRNWGEIKYHANECHNFTFAYCGDGILDSTHSETCDDGNNIDGDGCSATCQRETVPTCNSLNAVPNSGNTPLTSAFTCNATAATSYRIDVLSGTTILNTINSSTGSYTFVNTGSYTARCTINTNVTSVACLVPITVTSTTPPTPNIDINKLDANPSDLDGVVGNDTQTVNVSSGAVFRIRVTNNFIESLTNLVLTDVVAPNCAGSVILPSTFPSTWIGVTVGGSGSHTNAILDVGEYIDYTCDRSNTTAGYTNSATVNGIGLISNQNVTDTDTTVVLIPTISGPTCGTAGGYSFSYTETVWPATITFCSSGATVNPNPPVFPAQNGSTSWTCNQNSSTVNCSASRGDSGGGGGGGGGSGPSCTRISIPALEATGAGKAMSSTGSVAISCYGNIRSMVIGIDCDSDGNGSTKSITYQANSVLGGGGRVSNFTCNYNNLNTVPHPKCYVTSGGGIVTTSSVSSLACSTGLSIGPNFCGDGVVQRPNDQGLMEECEAVNGIFPSWCINCKTTNFTIPGEGKGILTFPGNGNIFFKPMGSVIIGAGSNPFTIFGQPYVSNDSSEDLYLNYPLCVYNTNSSVLLKSDNNPFQGICSSQNIGWLYPGVTRTFEGLNNGQAINIKGLKITDSTNYKDTILKTTLQGFPDAFFSAYLNVRVSKPAVATVGGGTSLIKNNKVTADINKVASDGYSNQNKNKNYVGAGISTGNSSSYSKNISGISAVTKVSSGQTQKVEKNLTKVTTTASIINKNIGDILTKYNGLSNVFIVKGNLTINTSIPGSGERTYIVEGGNLYINHDIAYDDNIAFVVKGGNIIIKSNVTKINGTFIVIGGNIISEETDNKLVINGILYGDIESLVNNRTHIENKNDLINVGTVVSFGSNLFRKQAPLVGDFIGEYIASKKVAK